VFLFPAVSPDGPFPWRVSARFVLMGAASWNPLF
jgi:hypothetical protein